MTHLSTYPTPNDDVNDFTERNNDDNYGESESDFSDDDNDNNLNDVDDDFDEMLANTFTCRFPACARIFEKKWNRDRHEERRHGVEGIRKEKEAKYAKMVRLLEAGNFVDSSDAASFFMSCLTTEKAVNVIIPMLGHTNALKLKISQFLGLPEEIQKISVFQRQKEHKDHLGSLNVRLKIGEEGQKELDEALSMGFTNHQFRTWKEKRISLYGICPSPGKRGYCVSLNSCMINLFPFSSQEWSDYDRKYPGGIVMTLSSDGGSMDRRNGAIIIKIQRRDEDWVIGNRFKKPNLNPTHSVLYMKETYEYLAQELGGLYQEILKPMLCSDNRHRNLVFGASDDMKMSLLKLGMGEVWRTTSHNICFRCHEKRFTSIPDMHHLKGNLNLEEWNSFAQFAEEDGDLSIWDNNDQTVERRTLLQIRETASKIEMLTEANEKEQVQKLKKETGVTNIPITTIPIHRHFLELIHLTEGVTKKVVKLMIVTVPPNSEMEKEVVLSFKRSADITFKVTKTPMPLWQRLDKARGLNRVKWLQLLNGFFHKGFSFTIFLYCTRKLQKN
jgi:hypothetical protein